MTITTPAGRVVRDERGMRLEFVRDFNATVQDVWSALTEPERLGQWFGTWSGDPATGSVDLMMSAEGEVPPQPVTITDCQQPNRLAVEMPSPDGTWPLTISLAAEAESARLVFSHRMAEPYDASSIGPGWHYYLDRLDAVVAGNPVPDNWDDYYPALADLYRIP